MINIYIFKNNVMSCLFSNYDLPLFSRHHNKQKVGLKL